MYSTVLAVGVVFYSESLELAHLAYLKFNTRGFAPPHPPSLQPLATPILAFAFMTSFTVLDNLM